MIFRLSDRNMANDDIPDLTLETRQGLPDALRVLLAEYPRIGWERDPGFDGLIRFWLDRHVMFRRILDTLRQGTEALIDKDDSPERYRILVSRYGGMFVNGLHEHHTIEDTHYFPRLAQRDTRVARGFDILDRDHHAIDADLNAFVAGANAVMMQAEDRDALQNAAGAFRDQLISLERNLNRHLLDEEDLIVPIILKYGTKGLG
ncbi:hemerythrin domain-containing protein [Yoonia sp. 2307UL14-13]|uniref:hemerythrin domain-containing protein n=1 Tax=Yoonia sp. 2307UL14-13 TaxID=3126506 RepID=UPI0030A7B209